MLWLSQLIGKGLPQRQECGDRLCDDRMLLDSGRDCPRCEDRQANSRAQRHAVAAAVDVTTPYASEAERRMAIDQQLHESVTVRAWARKHEWEWVRAQRAAAAKARAEAAAVQRADVVPAAPVAAVVLPASRPAAIVSAPARETATAHQAHRVRDACRFGLRPPFPAIEGLGPHVASGSRGFSVCSCAGRMVTCG